MKYLAKQKLHAKFVDRYLNITVKGVKYLTLEDKKINEKQNSKITQDEKEEKDDIINEEDKILSFSIRDVGEFQLLIKIKVEDYDLKESRPDKSLTKTNKGIYHFYFPLIYEDDSSDEDDKGDE